MRQPNFELRHIRAFVSAATTGSFRRAALELGIEQSAISRLVRSIEHEIGADLFRRSSGGVVLTETGQLFFRRCRSIASQIEEAVAEARTTGAEEHALRIGIFGCLSIGFLEELLDLFQRGHPGTKLHFVEDGPQGLVASVRRSQLDIAIVAEVDRNAQCDVVALWDEPVYLAMPKDDPLFDRQRLCWADVQTRHFVFADQPSSAFVRSYLVRSLTGYSTGPDIEQLPVNAPSLMQIVAHRGGVTIAGSAEARIGLPGIACRPIDNAVLHFGAVYLKGSLNRGVEHFIALAKSLSSRDQKWFADQSLIRPSQRSRPHAGRQRGSRGRTPDRLQ
jgi:DNA-binding transcriptional LysR family regulator